MCIKGDAGSGRATLYNQLPHDRRIPTELRIGPEFGTKIQQLSEKHQVKVQVWCQVSQTSHKKAGNEPFRSIAKKFYKGSTIVYLMYSINNRSLFESARTRLADIREVCPKAVILLLGNKTELEAKR